MTFPPFLLSLILCTSLAAQMDPYVTDVISTEGDTTVRVIITRNGWERISSRATVEWLVTDHEGDLERQAKRSITSVQVPCLEAGWLIASKPFFDIRNGRRSCIVECTHTSLLHPPHERLRIEIGRAGEVTCEGLNDTALIAAHCFMKPFRLPDPMRDTIGNDVRYVVESHVDGTVAESPWMTVRDTERKNADVLKVFGILDTCTESASFDGSISIALFAYECCAGTKSYYECYRIDREATQAHLVWRTLFMYGLEQPRALLVVADSITTTSSMRLFLNTDRNVPDAADYDDREREVWKHGIALVPKSTAWIVATKETDDGTWAFVIGRPVLTPDVRALFKSDNSKMPGTVAGWMKVGNRHK
ncbi:MAG: hypothetical protein JSS89_05350 [Bacteroidetes bacterium]|nr:hypothetical protein [Bacteroidota bacterium]